MKESEFAAHVARARAAQQAINALGAGKPAPVHDELHAEIARANRAEEKLARIAALCDAEERNPSTVTLGSHEPLLRIWQVRAVLGGGPA